MPQYAGGGYDAQRPRKGFAITALVCGIVGVPLGIIPFVGAPLPILAIIFGLLGISRAKHNPASGKGMAIAGFVLGVVGLILNIVITIVGIQNYQDCRDAVGHNPTQSEIRQCAEDGV